MNNGESAAATDLGGRGSLALLEKSKPFEVVMPAKRADFERRWAIVDSNHGPPPYQSGALTD